MILFKNLALDGMTILKRIWQFHYTSLYYINAIEQGVPKALWSVWYKMGLLLLYISFLLFANIVNCY